MTEEQKIREVIQNFWTEMFSWESLCNEYVDKDQDPPDEVYYGKLTAIYDQYVVQKERKMGLLQNKTILFPPTFDPEKEVITSVEITKNSATATSKGTHANRDILRTYKLKKVANNWRIDTVKEFFSYYEKWQNLYL